MNKSACQVLFSFGENLTCQYCKAIKRKSQDSRKVAVIVCRNMKEADTNSRQKIFNYLNFKPASGKCQDRHDNLVNLGRNLVKPFAVIVCRNTKEADTNKSKFLTRSILS